ncbi:Cupredoxin [Gigaspora margarita]|uniref:Cupredoxin n=1 Tax=Gigaspora margarita TaxID=4874 RepID=A0A8H4ER51_GIGMA|nr:Cupredoxin [Gigaspora margarita]
MYSYYKSATTKMMLCILVSCFFIPLSTYAANVSITVGPGLSFSPQNATANQGDTIVWTWAGGNHDVTQTDGPAGICTKSANASAFQSLVSPTTYSVTVNQTSGSIYYMCTVDSHCQSGMWGVILIGGSTASGSAAAASPTSTPSGGNSPSPSSGPKSSGTKNVNSNFMMIFGTVLIYILAFSSGML